MGLLDGIATLDDVLVDGRLVLVRVDFSVPMSGAHIVDDARIRASAGTIEDLCARGARVVLVSHLGDPGSSCASGPSLAPVGARLGEILGKRVRFVPACTGERVARAKRDLQPGGIALLENLRLHPGEKANDPAFAATIAEGIDVHVGDAFATAHRQHASIARVPRLVPARAAGRLVVRELRGLAPAIGTPARPFAAVLGGGKVADKIVALGRLAEAADVLLLGGRMGLTFLAAAGRSVGASPIEIARVGLAAELLRTARARIVLPVDHVVRRGDGLEIVRELQAGDVACDVGPRTAELFGELLAGCASAFWNGPLGMYEDRRFLEGTRGMMVGFPRAAIAGGGDTLAAVSLLGAASRFAHLSTGGGATLAYVGGRPLPGIETLRA
ncbi:phosphoglycerate kinase [Sorangium sp. So ce1389]|uniref:phosphoglycerate kinase n=1 Tax=Sorangium sp. So ce1389 TaxID=3133336 RepID=UPI003F5D8D43